jgi:hypothetical protein
MADLEGPDDLTKVGEELIEEEQKKESSWSLGDLVDGEVVSDMVEGAADLLAGAGKAVIETASSVGSAALEAAPAVGEAVVEGAVEVVGAVIGGILDS